MAALAAQAPSGATTGRLERPALTYEALRARLMPAVWLLVALTGVNVALALAGRGEALGTAWEVGAVLLTDALILAFLLRDRESVSGLLSLRTLHPGWILAVLPCFAVLYGFMSLYELVLSPFGIRFMALPAGDVSSAWSLWGVLLLWSVQPAVFEELAFRGFLMSRLSGVLTRSEILPLQAALFAIAHMLPLMFVSHFVIGLVLGVLRERSKSLLPSMLLHAAWNAYAVAFA